MLRLSGIIYIYIYLYIYKKDRGWIDGWEEEDDEIQSRDEILGFD